MGIFSRNKNSKDSPSSAKSSSQDHETSLEDKAQIIVEFLQDYKNDDEHEEFFEYNDLGIPLAIAITQDMVELTDSGLKVLEETWIRLCDLFDADVADSYDSIDDLIDSGNVSFEISESANRNSENVTYGSQSPESEIPLGESLTDEQIVMGIMQIFEEITGSPLDFDDFDKRFIEDLGIDSLSLVEGMIACEDMFNISISNREAFTLVTASQVVVHVGMKSSNL